jgi:hypothetical protein
LNDRDEIVSDSDPDPRDFMQRIERYAARLNPGLCAVALILSTLVAAEAATRLPALYDETVDAQTVPLTSDPTALVPVDIPPSE